MQPASHSPGLRLLFLLFFMKKEVIKAKQIQKVETLEKLVSEHGRFFRINVTLGINKLASLWLHIHFSQFK